VKQQLIRLNVPSLGYSDGIQTKEAIMSSTASYRIQFQKGQSLPQFLDRYGTEAKCRDTLFAMRWPDGFICPRCGDTRHNVLTCRPLIQCGFCKTQTSLTAGTVFHATKLPLTTWFLAIYLLTQTKTGLSSLELARHLGVNQKTAWLILHKLMDCMAESEQDRKLSEFVQVDDAYIGGELRGGKRGRGSQNKTPILMAIQIARKGNPTMACVSRIDGFYRATVRDWARRHLAPETLVVSDGLWCFRAVKDAGCVHVPVKALGQRTTDFSCFHWVNTILGNLKTGLMGVRHKTVAKYLHRFLALFQFRLNHRFDLSHIATTLIRIAIGSPPRSKLALMAAEFHG